ncbi:SGNH/GDSL hydrolase family protein [Streptacidiphilus sp. N1-12]|uniref:SGNH/GDSL hydrolase family protein n=2 Tax=Streptacidiphilus alkalitolerans TaxID=3342712 RepID=A0ABV6WFP1_9ACTN
MSSLALPVAIVLTGFSGLCCAPSARAAVTRALLRIEPLGDSITWGQGSSTGDGYRGLLGSELTSEGYTLDFVGPVRSGSMSDPDNEGHKGWRIDEIAGLTDSTLAAYRPNVVTLLLGTNDLVQNYHVATAPDRLHALVDRILADDPTATVLLADLPPSTSARVAQAEPAYDAAVRGIVRSERAAGRHVGYVDMGALTTADLADQLHPDDTGYRKMADAWNRGIRAADAAGWLRRPQP